MKHYGRHSGVRAKWRILVPCFALALGGLLVSFWAMALSTPQHKTDADLPSDSRSTQQSLLVVLGHARLSLQASLHAARDSGFQGRIVVLCHADVEACERMRTLVAGPLEVQRVAGTVLARMSGQLLVTSAYGYLQDAQQRGELPETVVVMDGQEVRWCGNVFQRLRSAAYRGAAVVAAMDDSHGALHNFVSAANATLGSQRVQRLLRAPADPFGSAHAVSGLFVGGDALRVVQLLRLAMTYIDGVPDGLAADPAVALASVELGPVLVRRMREARYVVAGDVCSAVCRSHDVVVETSACEYEAGGVHAECWRAPSTHRFLDVAAVDTATLLRGSVPAAVIAAWTNASVPLSALPPHVRGDAHGLARDRRRGRVRPFHHCPFMRQNLLVTMASSFTPHDLEMLLASLSTLPEFRANCTQLLLMVRDAEIWTAMLERTVVEGNTIVLGLGPYERQSRCFEDGAAMCRHGVLADWLRRSIATQSISYGLVLTLDARDTFLQRDPFRALEDDLRASRERRRVLNGEAQLDFVVMPSEGTPIAFHDWRSPVSFNAHQTWLSEMFSPAFYNAILTMMQSELASGPRGGGAGTAAPVPLPIINSGTMGGTPRALMHLLDLFVAAAAGVRSVVPTGPMHDQGIMIGVALVGAQLAKYPFPIVVMNPFYSSVVRHLYQRRGDMRTSRDGSEGTSGRGAYVSCDGVPYAVVHQLDRVPAHYADVRSRLQKVRVLKKIREL